MPSSLRLLPATLISSAESLTEGAEKMPWIELEEGRITLTMTRVAELTGRQRYRSIFRRTPTA